MTYLLLAAIAFLTGLLFRLRAEVEANAETVRFHNVNLSAAVLRIERKLDDIEKGVADAEARLAQDSAKWAAVITEMQAEKFRGLTDAMRDVVHETPDYAITGEDGEIPIRRVRSLRVHLARMEEMSRMAAEGSR